MINGSDTMAVCLSLQDSPLDGRVSMQGSCGLSQSRKHKIRYQQNDAMKGIPKVGPTTHHALRDFTSLQNDRHSKRVYIIT